MTDTLPKVVVELLRDDGGPYAKIIFRNGVVVFQVNDTFRRLAKETAFIEGEKS